MANFPTGIRFSGITATPGAFPGNRVASVAGNEQAFQGGNRMVGATLSLRTQILTPAQVATIRTHFDGEGLTGAWLVSAEILDGLEYASEYGTTSWRYAQPPEFTEVTSEAGGVNECSIELAQAPLPPFIDTLLLLAQPATVVVGSVVRLVGPDTLPTLWSSRLTTATRTPESNAGAQGAIIAGIDGASFQAFWFEAADTTAVRVVVVKRDAKGFVLWQRWTSAEFGDYVTSRDVNPPQVVPVSDGGCVVLAGSNTGSIPVRGWRLAGDGSQVWAMNYEGSVGSPRRAVINGSEVVVLTFSSVLLPGNFSRLQPMLLRLNLASGAVLGGNAYRIGGSSSDITPTRRDDVFVLPSGSIAFRIQEAGFYEVSSNGASVTRSVVFSTTGNNGNAMQGVATLLSNGGFLVRSSEQMLVELDSSFNIVNRFMHSNAMETGRVFWGLQTLAIGAGADGVGYAISYNFGAGDYLGLGLTIAKFSSSGGTVVGYNEVAYGAGIGAPGLSVNHDLDIVAGRGFVHLVGGAGQASGCRLTAIGFALDQPTITAANTTPAATLATGSCGNTMSVRGWDSVTYSTITPDTITRTVVTTTVSSVTITNTTGSLNMVDASASLSWSRSSLVF
jgi:hypothetical protein